MEEEGGGGKKIIILKPLSLGGRGREETLVLLAFCAGRKEDWRDGQKKEEGASLQGKEKKKKGAIAAGKKKGETD